MPKFDSSIYRGFLSTLENAKEKHYQVTLHFFRDPTLRGYVESIDKEVYVSTIETEEGNMCQIRLSQITSLTWSKNGNVKGVTIKNIKVKEKEKQYKDFKDLGNDLQVYLTEIKEQSREKQIEFIEKAEINDLLKKAWLRDLRERID
jgi:hypothetical protein